MGDHRPENAGEHAADSEGSDHLSFADVPRLELDELLQQLRERADDVLSTQGRLRGLLRANAAVAGELSLPVVLKRIVEAARELLRARYAALGVIGEDRSRLEQFVHSGMSDDVVEEIGTLPRGRGILGLLITEPSPIRLTNLSTHPASAGFPPGHPPMSTFLGVPIQVGDRVFGNLYLTEREDGRPFTFEDEQLALSLANTAGVAIANARLFSESEQRRRWLMAAGELTQQLLRMEIDRPLELITSGAAVAADADFTTLVMLREDEEISVEAAFGAMAEELVGHQVPMAGTLSGRVIETGKPLLVADLREESVDAHLSQEIGPLAVVPIAAGGAVAGVLSVGRLVGRAPFTTAEVSMMASFANQAAVALELVEARADQIRLAQLEDHDRIARDLHDNAIQEIFAVGLGLQAILPMVGKPALTRRISGYIEALDRVIIQIRKTIFELNLGPQYGSLQVRLLSLADEYTSQLGFSPEVGLTGSLDPRAAEVLSDDILAVAREALSNAVRHAQASNVFLSLDLDVDRATLVVSDNGCGIGRPERTSGLDNIRRRAERHGGTATFSTPPEGGTRIEWTASTASA